MRILIASLKGGVGKTTSAIHLAGALSEHGKTLLVDADPAEGALEWAARGTGLGFDVVKPEAAKPKRFDYVVVDTRAQPKAKTLDEFTRKADLLIVPCSPSTLALETLPRLQEELAGLPLRALLTIAPPPPSRDTNRAIARLEALGLPRFQSIMRRYAALEKAAVAGCLVRDVRDPKAASAWADAEALAHEVLE
ncbi:MAG: ParA family protein [Deinococcales bacterium]